MKLSNGAGNSIDDARFDAAQSILYSQHVDEFEMVNDGSGRSEEMPSDLARRHARELVALRQHRDEMSVMEWIRCYGDIGDHVKNGEIH